MPFSSTSTTLVGDDLITRLAHDPWSLLPAERLALRARHEGAQRRWLPRLRRLVEPPLPQDSFPAFLLELPPFARLGHEVAAAADARPLDVGTADELQRFVDRYRDWLAA